MKYSINLFITQPYRNISSLTCTFLAAMQESAAFCTSIVLANAVRQRRRARNNVAHPAIVRSHCRYITPHPACRLG